MEWKGNVKNGVNTKKKGHQSVFFSFFLIIFDSYNMNFYWILYVLYTRFLLFLFLSWYSSECFFSISKIWKTILIVSTRWMILEGREKFMKEVFYPVEERSMREKLEFLISCNISQHVDIHVHIYLRCKKKLIDNIEKNSPFRNMWNFITFKLKFFKRILEKFQTLVIPFAIHFLYRRNTFENLLKNYRNLLCVTQ